MSLLLLIIMTTYNPSIVLAKDTDSYLWVTPAWEGYTEQYNTGLYVELINAISKVKNIEIIKLFMPWERSLKTVNMGKAEMTGAQYSSYKAHQSKYPIIESDEGSIQIKRTSRC